MKLFTIGFTKTSAERFFARLRDAGVRKVVDIRLHTASQLAGFAKKDDLPYFLRTICSIEYAHHLELAPTAELLDAYRKSRRWDDYERGFVELLRHRRIEDLISRGTLAGACLLCSEDSARHCHRRLVAEYLKSAWGDVEIVHL